MENDTTAAIVIIGDEILQGEVQDRNSYFLCQELHKSGVKVMRIVCIPDVVDIIAKEIAALSKQYTYVITSGGIGPTHDDVTYKGIARAFCDDLYVNEEYERVMQDLCQDETSDITVIRRMCYIPKSSIVHQTKIGNQVYIPLVSIRNVYIFPGVPSYLQKMFFYLKSLFSSTKTILCRKFYLNVNELTITPYLDNVVGQFGDVVQFGSYMNVIDSSYATKITMKSDFEGDLQAAEAYLRSVFPMNSIINVTNPTSNESITSFKNLLSRRCIKDTKFITNLMQSVAVVEKCLKQYLPEEMCLSFNGGKDCTALLHLITCVLFQKKVSTKISIFYVCSGDSFPDVEDFVSQSVKRYGLNVLKYNCTIKDALEKLRIDHPEMKAIFLGTRCSDPHGTDMETFQMTDNNWPQFMRISPILQWSYHDVWRFLKELNIPYCSLYDRGYTSLGCCHNTLPNPKLKSQTRKGKEFYKPAYLLDDCREERSGRQK